MWRQAVAEEPDLRAEGEINSDNQRQTRDSVRMPALRSRDRSPTSEGERAYPTLPRRTRGSMPGVVSAQRDGTGSGRGWWWIESMLLFAPDVKSVTSPKGLHRWKHKFAANAPDFESRPALLWPPLEA